MKTFCYVNAQSLIAFWIYVYYSKHWNS